MGVLVRRWESLQEEERSRDRHVGRMPCDDGGRDWSDVSTSQGLLVTPEAEKRIEENFP